MRIAALYDIHGNLPALEAVIGEITTLGVDHIIVGGDVLPGPMCVESLELLVHSEIPTSYIRGNGEVAVLDELAGREPEVPPAYRDTIRASATQLSAKQQDAIAVWPATLTLNVPSVGEVLFCHATPGNENELVFETTDSRIMEIVLAGVTADVVVCGHTHMQFDRTVGKWRLINAGSVGMPFDEPGAYWLLLDGDIQLRRTSYDLEAAAQRIRASSYPRAAEFADKNIIAPPTRQAMLAAFRPAEVRN